MKTKLLAKIILILLVLTITTSDLPLATHSGGVEPAQAGLPGPNIVLGFIRAIEAINLRNRVYRSANITAKEFNDYYDTLIKNSQIASQEMEKLVEKGEISPTMLGSYKKIEAGLEAERKAVIEWIETEKKSARAEFKENLKKQVFSILLASPGIQNLIQDIRETINGLRQAVMAVRDALAGNLNTEAVVNQYTDQYGKGLFMKTMVRRLGSKFARKLDEKLNGLITRLEKPSQMAMSETETALQKIEELDQQVVKAQRKNRIPVSLLELGTDLTGFWAAKRFEGGMDTVATAYINKVLLLGLLDEQDLDPTTMRERIRKALLDARIEGLKLDALKASRFVDCKQSDRERYLAAMEKLGMQPEEPLDPARARYLVCTTKKEEETFEESLFESEDYVYAALIGPSKADAEAQAEETEVVVIIEEGESYKGDAASCDALEYVSFEVVEGPIKETSASGSYYCYINYVITNNHPDSNIVVSWKHDISSSDRGPYWTHPQLIPGGSYDLSLRSDMAANGNWRTVDGDYLMAWFATPECDYYKNDYWPTEEEPDKLLQAGFSVQEIDNPCGR